MADTQVELPKLSLRQRGMDNADSLRTMLTAERTEGSVGVLRYCVK